MSVAERNEYEPERAAVAMREIAKNLLAEGQTSRGRWCEVAAEQLERQRWIPVTERLPSDDRVVLMNIGDTDDGEDEEFNYIAMYGRYSTYCQEDYPKEDPQWTDDSYHKLAESLRVTHWREVPDTVAPEAP